jgi:predicted RNA-binding Zn ribbon-like protein
MKQFEMVGGALCLDFINTIHDYAAADPREELNTFEDFVEFVKQADAIPDRQASSLVRRAAGRQKEASRALSVAREFRGALFRALSAMIARKEPADSDWKILNRQISNVYRNAFLRKKGADVQWAWADEKAGLESVLWPIVRSAAELMASEKKSMVHECLSDTCTWLFLDVSKNHTRRWCDMKKCGNRAKWRRHYDKNKKKRSL